MKKVATLCAVVVLSAATFSPVLACEGKTAAAAPMDKTAGASLARAEFTVDGMSCAVACPAQIKTALAAVKGVSTVDVNFDTKTVSVSYSAKDVNTRQLAETINKLGYKAVEKAATTES